MTFSYTYKQNANTPLYAEVTITSLINAFKIYKRTLEKCQCMHIIVKINILFYSNREQFVLM